MNCLVDLLELAGEIAGGRGDGGDAERGAVPDDPVVEFGDGEIEAVAELVLHGAKDLAAILQGLGVRDFQFDGEFGDGHGSADEDQIDGHTDTDCGQDKPEDNGVARDTAGLPSAGAEFVNELVVAKDGAESDDDAKGDEAYS